MDIKDCKIGTRVVCVKDEGCNIPTGALGSIIEGCKEEFRKIVDLEPEVFNGVLVW